MARISIHSRRGIEADDIEPAAEQLDHGELWPARRRITLWIALIFASWIIVAVGAILLWSFV